MIGMAQEAAPAPAPASAQPPAPAIPGPIHESRTSVGTTSPLASAPGACSPPCAAGGTCLDSGQCSPVQSYTRDSSTAPAQQKPGSFLHDGAYLRLGLGFGATLGSARVGSTDLTSSGLGLALEIAAGWAPIPGLVIGGEMSPTGSLSQTVSGGGVNKANTGGLLSFFFGPFVDFYPYPTKGFHVEAGVGLGAMIWSKGPEATAAILLKSAYSFVEPIMARLARRRGKRLIERADRKLKVPRWWWL
jgi:hypothetical protein